MSVRFNEEEIEKKKSKSKTTTTMLSFGIFEKFLETPVWTSGKFWTKFKNQFSNLGSVYFSPLLSLALHCPPASCNILWIHLNQNSIPFSCSVRKWMKKKISSLIQDPCGTTEIKKLFCWIVNNRRRKWKIKLQELILSAHFKRYEFFLPCITTIAHRPRFTMNTHSTPKTMNKFDEKKRREEKTTTKKRKKKIRIEMEIK